MATDPIKRDYKEVIEALHHWTRGCRSRLFHLDRFMVGEIDQEKFDGFVTWVRDMMVVFQRYTMQFPDQRIKNLEWSAWNFVGQNMDLDVKLLKYDPSERGKFSFFHVSCGEREVD